MLRLSLHRKYEKCGRTPCQQQKSQGICDKIDDYEVKWIVGRHKLMSLS